MKMFDKKTRSTFPYWFWHWLAFQKIAIKLGVWKPKYLLHDMEKPWLLLFWRNDYKRVQKWHREHRRHHLEYGVIHGWDKVDWVAMAIDWECCHLTKKAQPYGAYSYMLEYIDEKPIYRKPLVERLLPVLRRLGIDKPFKRAS